MRTVKIEWRDEWEYCVLFYDGEKLVTCAYMQNVDTFAIAAWLKHGIKP